MSHKSRAYRNGRVKFVFSAVRVSDLDEFVALYRPGKRHVRKASWSEENAEGRWRSYEYDELMKRDKVNLDIFWLRDLSLEDSKFTAKAPRSQS
jgi:type I restriction enzyme M protein